MNTEMRSDKIQKRIDRAANAVIRIILLVITSGLFLQSLFSTSFIGTVTREDGSLQERTLNIADAPWKHLLFFLFFTAAGSLFYNRCHIRNGVSQKKTGWTDAPGQTVLSKRWSFRLLSALVLVTGTAWIMMTQLSPGSDPAKVYGIAMQWRRGNFSAYAEGGYLFRYPFQAGIILFYYLLSFVFGLDNYVGLQLVNVLALLAVYVLLVKLSALFWKKDEGLPIVVYTALILWVPIAFYVTYLYGILPGMALSLGAVYFAARYFDTRKYQYLLPACVCMGLATVIKMNCLIYLVAIACFLLYDALMSVLSSLRETGKAGRRWAGSLAAIALMGLSVAGCSQATAACVETLSGYEAGDGEAMVSWVVMGLQETPLGPGGYSGYIGDIFVRYEYDTDKIVEASIADIRKIMTRMSENILDEGVTFFARKNAFQWNDPTFISLDRTRGRNPAVALSAFVRSLIDGRGSVILSVLLNYAQTLLLLGMLLYVLLCWRSDNLYELLGAVVFLGGYLFHFIWESSASYTIPYFVILIPYAVKGLADYIRSVATAPARWKECRKDKAAVAALLWRNKLAAGSGLVVLALLFFFSRTNLFDRTIALNDGEEARAQFYHEDKFAEESSDLEETKNTEAGAASEETENAEAHIKIPDGYYYLSPYTAQEMSIAEENGEVTMKAVQPDASAKKAVLPVSAVTDLEHKLLLNTEWKPASGQEAAGISLRFRSNEQVLAVREQEETFHLTVYRDDDMNLFYEPDDEVTYRWEFEPADEEGYYIMIDGMALTYRDGEAVLEELERSEEQRWVLRW